MDEIYGAYAKVYIQSDLSLKELGSFLEKKGFTPPFEYDTDMDEPHELFGAVSAFGFSGVLWEIESVEKEKWGGYKYSFELDTTDSHTELFNDRMHNLSFWLARLMAIYGVTTMAVNSDGCTGQYYTQNQDTYEIEMKIIQSNG